MKSLQEEDKLKGEIAEKHEQESVLHARLQTLRNVHQEMTNRYNVLSNKEKAIGKLHTGDFATLNKLNVELLDYQFRRRPRVHLKYLEASDFLDLANHVITRSPCVYLPMACKDYLRNLNNLDVRPVTVPLTIDSTHWESLVRLRRQKIGVELRNKGEQAAIAALDGVIVGFEQKIEKCKSDIEDMTKNVIELRKRRIIDDLNVEIQLVLKMGQVEINLEGDATDTKNAILIPKSGMDTVNKLIGAAGACKLEALSRLLSFQRGIPVAVLALLLSIDMNRVCNISLLSSVSEMLLH